MHDFKAHTTPNTHTLRHCMAYGQHARSPAHPSLESLKSHCVYRVSVQEERRAYERDSGDHFDQHMQRRPCRVLCRVPCTGMVPVSSNVTDKRIMCLEQSNKNVWRCRGSVACRLWCTCPAKAA